MTTSRSSSSLRADATARPRSQAEAKITSALLGLKRRRAEARRRFLAAFLRKTITWRSRSVSDLRLPFIHAKQSSRLFRPLMLRFYGGLDRLRGFANRPR
jgi:hypothetical protein